jgi:hypothetical protein
MRRLLEHSGVPGHIYPLSLLCYEVMPPPQKVYSVATSYCITLDIFIRVFV